MEKLFSRKLRFQGLFQCLSHTFWGRGRKSGKAMKSNCGGNFLVRCLKESSRTGMLLKDQEYQARLPEICFDCVYMGLLVFCEVWLLVRNPLFTPVTENTWRLMTRGSVARNVIWRCSTHINSFPPPASNETHLRSVAFHSEGRQDFDMKDTILMENTCLTGSILNYTSRARSDCAMLWLRLGRKCLIVRHAARGWRSGDAAALCLACHALHVLQNQKYQTLVPKD